MRVKVLLSLSYLKTGYSLYKKIRLQSYWCADALALGIMTQNEFSVCKAEDGDVAVAALTDDNAADGNPGKSLAKMSVCRYTRACLKNHCAVLNAPLCGIQRRNFGRVAPLRSQNHSLSPANWSIQPGTSIFQTHSSVFRHRV